MGTNYYLLNKTTNEKLHLCKLSHGWKPLFQAHEGKFKSVFELETIMMVDYSLEIIDEYDRVIDYSQFVDKILDKQYDSFSKSHMGTGCNAFKDIDGYEWTYWEFS